MIFQIRLVNCEKIGTDKGMIERRKELEETREQQESRQTETGSNDIICRPGGKRGITARLLALPLRRLGL